MLQFGSGRRIPDHLLSRSSLPWSIAMRGRRVPWPPPGRLILRLDRANHQTRARGVDARPQPARRGWGRAISMEGYRRGESKSADAGNGVAQRAGRLRDDLRDDSGARAGRTPYLLAAAAAVPPPPPPAVAPAAVPDGARWQVPAASRPASRARTDARQRRRRRVPVLACAAVAGLITVMLAVTVGAAVSWHPVGALPSAAPRHSASGTVTAPPAREPSSAGPSRKAHRRPGPGDTGMVQMAASDHRAITAPGSGHQKIRRHRHGKDAGHGNRHGNGHGHGNASALSVISYLTATASTGGPGSRHARLTENRQ